MVIAREWVQLVSDADAVEFRVMPWIVWKYNIDQYFYW